MRMLMGLWTNVRDWLVRGPDGPVEHTRSHTGEVFDVQVIDGVAVPGAAMRGQVNYRRGMSIPAGWRCAVLLSDLLGSVPWHAYREGPGGRAERVFPTPPLISRPDPRPNTTRMDTFTSWALDLIWEGNSIGIIAALDVDGLPAAVLPVPTRMCGVRRIHEHSMLPIGSIEYNIGGLTYGEHEVIHIKGPHEPGAVRGMGVLEAHFAGINLSHELRRQAAGVADAGVPTGEVKMRDPDASRPEMRRAKKLWTEAFRDRTVAVTNQSTEPFQPISWNPEEMQLLEARRFDLHEWALIFGMPLRLLGVEQTSRTYQNVEHENTELLRFTMGGHLGRFEQTLSLHRPLDQFVQANLDAVLRSDTNARYESHKTAIEAGFLSVDEVREIEDLPPLPQAPDSQEDSDE